MLPLAPCPIAAADHGCRENSCAASVVAKQVVCDARITVPNGKIHLSLQMLLPGVTIKLFQRCCRGMAAAGLAMSCLKRLPPMQQHEHAAWFNSSEKGAKVLHMTYNAGMHAIQRLVWHAR